MGKNMHKAFDLRRYALIKTGKTKHYLLSSKNFVDIDWPHLAANQQLFILRYD